MRRSETDALLAARFEAPVNRRLVAGVAVAALVLGSLGGLAATAFSNGADRPPSGEVATDAGVTPQSWLVQARAVYDAIAPVTDDAAAAVEAGDDAAYAAANSDIAALLERMPAHPDGEVDVLYASVAEAHREIAADADLDGAATVAAQERIIALLGRIHQIVPAL